MVRQSGKESLMNGCSGKVNDMGISLEQHDGEWYDAFPQSGGVYDLIRAAVYGENGQERLGAIVSLGRSGDPRAVRPLVDLLQDNDREIRLGATRALGALHSGRPVDELVDRLRDRSEDEAIRREAAVTLAAIRSTGALRGLREFVADESEDPALRSCSGELLRDIGAL